MRENLGPPASPPAASERTSATPELNQPKPPAGTPAVQERTPWRALIATALRLGLAPEQFWRLSLREWRALVAPSADAPMTRAAFDTLARLYPDRNQ